MSLPARTDRLPGDWMGQDSTSSRAVVQQGAEDPGSPCAPQARPCVCPPQDTTLGSLSHPRTPQHWGGWRGDGISSTALLWHKELGPGPRLAQCGSRRGSQVRGSWQWGHPAVSSRCCSTCTVHKAKPNLLWSRAVTSCSTISVSAPASGGSKAGARSWHSQGTPHPGHAPCRSLTHGHVH